MKFSFASTLAAATALAAVANCAPATSRNAVTAKGVLAKELGKRNNDCDESTFINQTTAGSPTVADCTQLANNIAPPGTWSLNPGTGQRTIATFGTCAVGMQNIVDKNFVNVGNDDVRDIIFESIKQFQWNGLVGAKGEMKCQTNVPEGPDPVSWGIYHT